MLLNCFRMNEEIEMFKVNEVCECNLLIDLLSFSLIIDQAPNFLQHPHRNDGAHKIYSSYNRSNNYYCMHLFILKLI